MKLSKIYFLLFYVFVATISGCSTSTENEGPKKGWNLVWSDEFNYTGLPDSTRWFFEVGGHGWGNNELQFYTANRTENARVENGNLIIEARKESYSGKNYTSVRLNSKGDPGSWLYGRFEIRAKLPRGRGTWPALWMLPTDWTYGNGGWPDNGEIDIMEHVGFDPGVIHASTHSLAYYWRINTQKTATISVPNAMDAFHVYTLEWTADSISMFVDSNKYFTFANEHRGWERWPFDKRFHFIFNIAIGGDWGGQQGVDDSIFPQKMEIDYARVYRYVE